MLTRRSLTSLATGATLVLPALAHANTQSFDVWLEGLRGDAQRAGVSQPMLQRALQGIQPIARVLELDRRQPEFTLSWEQYRDRQLSQSRIDRGRSLSYESRALLEAIAARYKVSPRVIVAIWGMETNFGSNMGSFYVVEALATLAYDGRRSQYFRNELISALKILDAGHVAPDRMKGSWAGAMGQPQFMPSSFERLAVDFDGDGHKNIWESRADALGSIGNYLARSGWREGEPWGREVILPAGFDPEQAKLENKQSLREWARQGIRAPDGRDLATVDLEAAVLLPGGAGSQAFVVHTNFMAIRRYNPSTFYALSIGLLSDRVA